MSEKEPRSDKEHDNGEQYGKQPWRDEELMRRLFVEEARKQGGIAERFDCSPNTVSKWVNRHGLKPPHRDKDRLEELHHNQLLSLNEIAEELNVSYSTVRDWMDRLDVEKREASGSRDKLWRHAATLEYLYWEKGLTTGEVGERLGCKRKAVAHWMEYHDIPRRSVSEATSRALKVPYAGYHTNENGYERWHAESNSGGDSVRVHRLVAVAEYGFEAVRNRHIHHKNGVPWDNRPSNLQPMTVGDHMSHHNRAEGGNGGIER